MTLSILKKCSWCEIDIGNRERLMKFVEFRFRSHCRQSLRFYVNFNIQKNNKYLFKFPKNFRTKLRT